MILRLKRRKPGEQQEQPKSTQTQNTMPTPKKKMKMKKKMKNHSKQKKPAKKKKVDEIPDSPFPEDVLNLLMERFFPGGEDPGLNTNNPIVEDEELDEGGCSRLVWERKEPEEGERIDNGEVGKSKKRGKRGRKRKHHNNNNNNNNNNKVDERVGVVDLPPLVPERRIEVGFGLSDEVEMETETLVDSQERNQLGYGHTQNEGHVRPSSTNSGKRRRGRGITTLPHITEDTSGIRKVVEYNSKGQPIGPVANNFTSYLGVLGRKMVPIIYESWHKVPKELKEILLNHVEAKYVIEPKRRKSVISSIGGRWKSFKTHLTRVFITPFKDHPELISFPPEKYSFIKQEHWVPFVRLRLTEKFQHISKCQSERRSKGIYNHRLGRKGYAGLIERLKRSLGTAVDELDRSVLWKKARQNKEGDYVDEAVREKAELIDELTKQKENGNLATRGKNDILALALGTPEHSDRVRGVGPVTPNAYFQLPKRNSWKYIGELEQKVNQQADQILEMNQIVQELQAHSDGISPQGPPAVPSSEATCGSQDESDCPNDDHPVQFGFETGCQSMDKGNRNVGISPPDHIMGFGLQDESGCPNDDHAVQFGFQTDCQDEEIDAVEDKLGPIQAFLSFIDQSLPADNIIIPIQSALFGEEVEAHLQKVDLMDLCNMQEVTASCIITYIRFLSDNLISYQERYGFVNPASISSARGPGASSIITKRLQNAKEDQHIFIPYKKSGHWTLIVINLPSMDVFWLDPMQKPLSMEIKIYVTTGLKALQTDGKRRPNPTWHCIKCPKQSLDIHCGYFVMKYMRELMEESSRPLSEKILQLVANTTYSQDEVDEVRLELIDFILTNM